MHILLSLIVFLFFGVTTTAGLMLLKKAMAGATGLQALVRRIFGPYFIAGFLLYLTGFLSWLFILSRYRLSLAYPVATSLLFVLINLGSALVFKDRFEKKQFWGTLLCLLGITLLSV